MPLVLQNLSASVSSTMAHQSIPPSSYWKLSMLTLIYAQAVLSRTLTLRSQSTRKLLAMATLVVNNSPGSRLSLLLYQMTCKKNIYCCDMIPDMSFHLLVDWHNTYLVNIVDDPVIFKQHKSCCTLDFFMKGFYYSILNFSKELLLYSVESVFCC